MPYEAKHVKTRSACQLTTLRRGNEVATHRLAVAPVPGAVGWVSPVQADPEVPIVTENKSRAMRHINNNTALSLAKCDL